MAATITKGYSFGSTELVTNTKLSTLVDSATISGIANSELAAPQAYFTVCICRDGQFTTTIDPLATFQMPFAATLVEVSACARDIDLADENETYTIDVEEAGTTVLDGAIAITADNTPVVGTIADSAIADNAKMEIVLTLDGTSPAIDDITILLTFKKNHVA